MRPVEILKLFGEWLWLLSVKPSDVENLVYQFRSEKALGVETLSMWMDSLRYHIASRIDCFEYLFCPLCEGAKPRIGKPIGWVYKVQGVIIRLPIGQ